MSKNYRTEGKEKLVGFMSTHPDMHFTVDEICENIHGDLSARSSIYRNLSALCEDGHVRKFRAEGERSFVYQYVGEGCGCENHFHLKCMVCGQLKHLECEISEEMRDHIMESHGFSIDCGRSILYGICCECSEGGGYGHSHTCNCHAHREEITK